jgi:hypothetical protein
MSENQSEMSLKEITHQIKANNQKMAEIQHENELLTIKMRAIKQQLQIEQFKIGMYVYDDNYQRIGKIEGFAISFEEIMINCRGFDIHADDEYPLVFSMNVKRAHILSMTDMEFNDFKLIADVQKMEYHRIIQQAKEIEIGYSLFFKNQIEKYTIQQKAVKT